MNCIIAMSPLQLISCPLKKPWIFRLSSLFGGQAVQAEAIALVSPQPSATTSQCPASTLYWYHRSHGENALNCRKPCSWSGN